jgi:hypothetical protein
VVVFTSFLITSGVSADRQGEKLIAFGLYREEEEEEE